MKNLLLLLVFPLLALVAGCTAGQPAPTEGQPEVESVMLRTAQPVPPGQMEVCMTALAQGTLVPDARSGLGLGGNDGHVTPVVWPAGYSAVRIDGVIHLLDPNRQLVAREGDRVEAGGGFGQGDFWFACGGIEVVD